MSEQIYDTFLLGIHDYDELFIEHKRLKKRIAELEAAIRDAPHYQGCASRPWTENSEEPCDCWKSKALEKGEIAADIHDITCTADSWCACRICQNAKKKYYDALND